MNTKTHHIQTMVVLCFGAALNWAINNFWPWRWLVPTALLLVELWLLLQEDSLSAKGTAILAIVSKPKKRKELLLGLLRIAGQAALIGVTIFFVWTQGNRWHLALVESHLSWRARQFWKCQCLGMKTFGITGVVAKDVLQYAPDIRKLPYAAQQETVRQSIIELQEKGVIRGDIPPAERTPGIIVQDTVVTEFGRKLCTYYLTDYEFPKPAEEPPKTE